MRISTSAITPLSERKKGINLSAFGDGGPWGWGGGLGGFNSGTVTGQTSTIPVGTLLVDLYDPARKQLVWRGDGTKTIDLKKTLIRTTELCKNPWPSFSRTIRRRPASKRRRLKVKSQWTIGFLVTCALAISANAQENSSVQTAEGPIANFAQQNSGGATSPATQLQAPAGSRTQGPIQSRLEEVLGAMSAELAEIAQAAREGKISRDQAEYLSLERYYVALTRFQLLRTLYQPPQESDPSQSYAKANTSPRFPGGLRHSSAASARLTFPNQLVDYLHLTLLEIQAIQAKVTEQCKQVQPL